MRSLLACGALLVVLMAMDPDGLLGEVAFMAATVGAPIAGAIAVWRRRVDMTVGLLVVAGLGASAAADVLWQVEVWRTAVEPDVSSADVGWLLAYPCIGGALLVILRRSDYRLRRDVDSLFDLLEIGVLVMLAVWMMLIAPTLSDGSVPLWVRSVWVLYPVLDTVLLGLLVRLFVSRSLRGRSVPLLAVGLGLWLMADLGFVSPPPWPWAETALNAGWMMGSMLMAASVWALSDLDVESIARRRGQLVGGQVGHWRVIAAVLPLAVPWLVVLWGRSQGRSVDFVPLFLASIALSAVVCARTLHLVRIQRDAQHVFRAAAMTSSDATLIVSRTGLLLQDAPGLGRMLGDPSMSAAGTDLSELVAAQSSPPGWLDEMLAEASLRPGAAVEREVAFAQPGGDRRWMLLRLVDLLDEPRVDALLVNVHDISDRKAMEERLEHQAFHDALTGLPNRALFSERLHRALVDSSTLDHGPALLFLDLDDFKLVNDRLGHEMGDELLTQVSARLAAAVRPEDTIARLGGDEFAVLLGGAGAEALDEAIDLGQRLLDTLAAPVELDGSPVVVSASIGIAAAAPGALPSSLLRDADTAMFHAKASGRCNAVVYNSEMRERDHLRVRVEADLLDALHRGEFHVEYQPVVDLGGGRITGFEALLRWDHPELGSISPEVFIPVAERNGAIVGLGSWAALVACQQLRRWHDEIDPELTIAVNVSGRQLAEPRFARSVIDAVEASGVSPHHLVLELTETSIVSDIDATRATLLGLRELGVRTAIDDFGTGYSSLSYLQELPIDILKIDRSFTANIHDGRRLPVVVQSILDLAQGLGLHTVAEGIESIGQLERLRAHGCDAGQGFLIAGSLRPDAATAMLRRGGWSLSEPPGLLDATPAGRATTR